MQVCNVCTMYVCMNMFLYLFLFLSLSLSLSLSTRVGRRRWRYKRVFAFFSSLRLPLQHLSAVWLPTKEVVSAKHSCVVLSPDGFIPCLSVGVSSALLAMGAGPKHNLHDGHLVYENFPSILPYPADYNIPSPLFFLSLFVSFFSPSFFFFRSSRGGMWRERAILRNPGDREFHKASTLPLARSPVGFSPPARLTPNLTMKHHQIFQAPSQPMQQEPLEGGRAPRSTNYSKILSDSERCDPPWVWDRLKPTQEPCWGHRPSHRVIHADSGCDDSCRLRVVMMQEGRRC